MSDADAVQDPVVQNLFLGRRDLQDLLVCRAARERQARPELPGRQVLRG